MFPFTWYLGRLYKTRHDAFFFWTFITDDDSAVAAINKAITDITNRMKQAKVEDQEEEETQKTVNSNENEVIESSNPEETNTDETKG